MRLESCASFQFSSAPLFATGSYQQLAALEAATQQLTPPVQQLPLDAPLLLLLLSADQSLSLSSLISWQQILSGWQQTQMKLPPNLFRSSDILVWLARVGTSLAATQQQCFVSSCQCRQFRSRGLDAGTCRRVVAVAAIKLV